MKKSIFFCFVLTLYSCSEESSNMTPVDIYETKCAQCHGSDGKAGVMGAFDLSKSALDELGAKAVIENGKGAMPSFNSQLDSNQIKAVAKYIQTLKK